MSQPTQQDTTEVEITKYTVNFFEAAASAVDDVTPGGATGAKAVTKIFGPYGYILDFAIIGIKWESASIEDRNEVLKSEGSKLGTSISAGLLASAIGGPIAGLIVGAGTSIGLNIAEAKTGNTPNDLFQVAYNAINASEPEVGILTTHVKDVSGNIQLTVEQNSETGEIKYIDPNLNVTRFELDAAGNYKTLEITKNGNSVDLDFTTGDYTATDVNGNSYSGNLADASLGIEADAIIGSMLGDFNAEIQQTNPGYDVFTDVINTIGSTNDLTVQISGRDIFVAQDFTIDAQNQYGGTTINYQGLSISTDAAGQSVVRTINPATGEVRGIFYNSDGTKTLFYADENAVDGVAEQTFTNLSDLSGDALYQAQQVLMDASQILRNGMREVLENNPELLGDLSTMGWPPELLSIVEAAREDVLANKAEEGKLYDVTADTSTTSADGNTTYQKATVGVDIAVFQLSDQDLVTLATLAPDEFADLRVGAFWELHARAIANGTVSTNAAGNEEYTLPSGAYLEVVDTGDVNKTVELIKYQGVIKPVGVVTTYGNSFQQQVVEILDSTDNSVIVNITTSDLSLNQAFTGGTVTLKYPENFVFSDVGGYVGNMLGRNRPVKVALRDLV